MAEGDIHLTWLLVAAVSQIHDAVYEVFPIGFSIDGQ